MGSAHLIAESVSIPILIQSTAVQSQVKWIRVKKAHAFFGLVNAVMGPCGIHRVTNLFMRKTVLLALGLVAACLCAVSCGGNEVIDIYGSISGKVTDVSTGDPLTAAQVTLIPGANTIQTSADGEFSFSGLDEGQYTVSVQKSGYQANRKNVTVISGESTNIVVTLAEIPKN